MKNKQAIEIIKDIAGQHNNPAEKRAFEKAVAVQTIVKILLIILKINNLKTYELTVLERMI